MYLFGDTETTAFSLSGALKQAGQARVCQIALLLTDENGKSIAEFSSLVKPEGWNVGDSAEAVHGYSTLMCEKYGLSHYLVMHTWQEMASKAKFQVYHNASFDTKMLQIEQAYFYDQQFKFAEPEVYCTMLKSTDICKVPHPTRRGNKWPKLDEALKILCNKSLGDQAHDALWDARACKDIFFAMKKMGLAA